MWAQQKSMIRNLAAVAMVLALGVAAAPAQAQGPTAFSWPSVATLWQIDDLTCQINALQEHSADLHVQVQKLQDDMPSPFPQAQPSAPELQAALQPVTEAKSATDALRQKLVSAVHDSNAYRNADTQLADAQARLDSAKAENPVSHDQVASLATEVLADENALTRLEQQALDASPDWQDASAKFLAANKAASAVRAKLTSAAPKPPAPDTTPAGQLRQAIAARDQIDAQIDSLLRQLRALSPQDADRVVQEGVGTRELKEQDGNSEIHFTSDVSPQVRANLLDNLMENQRMQDPAYAAQKQQEQQQQAERAEQQKAQDAANQAAQAAADQAAADRDKALQDQLAQQAQQLNDFLNQQAAQQQAAIQERAAADDAANQAAQAQAAAAAAAAAAAQ